MASLEDILDGNVAARIYYDKWIKEISKSDPPVVCGTLAADSRFLETFLKDGKPSGG